MKKIVLSAMLLSTAVLYHAQVAIGNQINLTPNTHAMLDVKSDTKGFLMPRVALTSLTTKAPITGSEANAPESLLVYNTATAGTAPDDIAPGFYYWHQIDATTGKWIKVIDQNTNVEPWLVQNSGTRASDNAQSIFQNGNVAIGTTSTNSASSQKLYVYGSVLEESNSLDKKTFAYNTLYDGSIYSEAHLRNPGEDYANQKGRAYQMLDSGFTSNYNPLARIFAGSATAATGNRTGLIHINSSPINSDGNGFGVINLNATRFDGNKTPIGTNTNLGVDNKGVKIGIVREGAKTSSNYEYTGDFGLSGSLVVDGYYLPNTPPTTGQILMYNDFNNATAASDPKITTTKWGSISDLIAVPTLWNTQATSTASPSITDNMYHTGKVAIGTTSTDAASTSALYVKGDITLTGKVLTPSSVFADYVFEKYFTGTSKIYDKYTFTSLSDVKDFIKKNHHLPGVTSIDQVEKTENGYTLNLAELSMQQLEKLEELYIHVIEQQDQLNAKNQEIETLKSKQSDLEKRLLKLENSMSK